MGKQIVVRLLALAGAAACAYAVVASLALMMFHAQVELKLAQWCTARTGCQEVAFEASVDEPVIRLRMKTARTPYRTDALYGEMLQAGVFSRPATGSWPIFTTRQPRINLQ